MDVVAWTALVGALDHGALRTLLARRLGKDALTALVLAPLLTVAWQSAETIESKRAAMREASAAIGLEAGDLGTELLLRSIEAPNAADIMARWRALVHILVGTLDTDVLSALQWELMDRAWLMASTLYGSDASRWPMQAFQALRALEGAFYERALGNDQALD